MKYVTSPTENGRCFQPALGSPEGPANLRLPPLSRCHRYREPSRSFVELTRNIELAEQAPRRFEPTVKEAGDVVI